MRTPASPDVTRRSLLKSAGVATLLGVGACGPGSARSGVASDGDRSVSGALGDIVVPASPGRIVSVGQYRDTDAAVALGTVPLLSPDLGTFIAGGVAPWVAAELQDDKIQLMDATELPYERIAGQRPDLILATDRLSLADEYDQLSEIAPTLSWDEGYNEDDWLTTTRRIGAALGKDALAEQVITTTQAIVNQARTALADLAGRTFTLGPVTADGVVNTINSPSDASAEFLADLGLELSPAVTALES